MTQEELQDILATAELPVCPDHGVVLVQRRCECCSPRGANLRRVRS